MHDEETIEDMILNSILILIIEACGLEQRHFCVFTLEEVHRIKSSDIYIDLKEGIPFRNWMEEDILVLSYEYIVGKREKKEKYGIYYTPRWLVKYIVDRSVKQNIFNGDDIRDIKILEPACGSGIFILYLFDILYNWYTIHSSLSPEEAIRIIVENNIYGVDVDTKGINLCKYSLMIKIIRELGYMPKMKFNLDNCDFLKDTKFEDLKFDYIIGNPPYLENRRINKYFDKKYLKDRFKTATGRFDIFSIFIEKALELLSEGGRVAYILPATLLTNNNFTGIRSLILENSSIYEITNLGEEIFNNVDMNMAIIILIKAKNQEERNKIFCNNIVNSQRKEIDILVGNYREISQNYYLTTLNNVFDIDSSLETFDIRNKIFKQGYVKINDICEVIAGIATGNVNIVSDLKVNIEGLDVIVVDDIMDSGLTMKIIIDHLKTLKPNSIKSCVLLDKPERRKADIKPDYVGFTIPDVFIVGYGLNYGDYFRNIPYIFTFED